MKHEEAKSSSSANPWSRKRKAIGLSAAPGSETELVKTGFLAPGLQLPLVVQPRL